MSNEELSTVIDSLESSKEEYAALLDIARVIWYQHRDHVEAAEFPEQFLQSYRNREGDDPSDPKTADWYSELEATGILNTDFCGRYNPSTGLLDICAKHNRIYDEKQH